MPAKPIVYLDHNATTPVASEIIESLPMWARYWGNPSSIHTAGREPKQILRESRKAIAEKLNCSPLEIVFTSGGTEANNSILKSVWFKFREEKSHFITSSVEHPSIMKTMEWLEVQGAKVDYINVSRNGELDLEQFQSCLSSKTALVSIMAANNEFGSIFPTSQLAKWTHDVGALFHMDAVQAFGKIPLDLKQLDVDFASFSAHKIYSIKGSGAMYIRKNTPFETYLHGGGQERHRRGGTENILGIAAFGKAVQIMGDLEPEMLRIEKLRHYFESRVLNEIPNASVTAALSNRLPGTSSLVLPGADGETMLMSLDLKGFAVSTGAACSSGNPEPSPALLSIGLSRQEAQNSLRVSIGRHTTLEQMSDFVDTLKTVIERLRAIDSDSSGKENLHV